MDNTTNEFLREYRKNTLGLSLREAAKKVGIDFTHLSKIENGVEPEDKTLLKIMEGYKMSDEDRVALMLRTLTRSGIYQNAGVNISDSKLRTVLNREIKRKK